MSEQAAPQPVPPAGAPKRLSGHLLASLGISIASVYLLRSQIGMFVVVVGPLVAGVLAVVGRRRTRRDPSLIGPRFALVCLTFAIVALCFQGFVVYRSYPFGAYNQKVQQRQWEFLEAVRAREYDKVYESLAPEHREVKTLEQVRAALVEVFPGEEPIELDLEGARIREGEVDKDEYLERVQALISEKEPDFEYVWPWRIGAGESEVDVDIRMRVTKSGYADFEASILDFSFTRAAKGEEGEPDEGTPEDGAPEEPEAPENLPEEGGRK